LDDALSAESNRIRSELLDLYGVPHDAGVDAVFAASGTDMHLIAAQLFNEAAPKPPRLIMVESSGTLDERIGNVQRSKRFGSAIAEI
jgi:hypothetical protein